MPTITPGLVGHHMRVLLDGVDYSCRLDGVTVMLNNMPVDVSNFSDALKSQVVGTPDAQLQMTGQLDTGTVYGTQAMLNRKLGAGNPVNFVVQPAGHSIGGLVLAGTALLARVESHLSVAEVLTVQIDGICTGNVWLARTAIPITEAITTPGVGWAYASIDRAVLPTPFSTVPFVGSAYFQVRNGQQLARSVSVWTSATPFVPGTAPSGSELLSARLQPNQTIAGAIGTPGSPASFQRYVAIAFDDSVPTAKDYAYLALVDEELSLVTSIANPTMATGGEPETPLLYDDNLAPTWDDSIDVIVAAWP